MSTKTKNTDQAKVTFSSDRPRHETQLSVLASVNKLLKNKIKCNKKIIKSTQNCRTVPHTVPRLVILPVAFVLSFPFSLSLLIIFA